LKTAPHNLEEYLAAELDGACLREDPKGPLLRAMGRGADRLTNPHRRIEAALPPQW
jgi:hypothetical protein